MDYRYPSTLSREVSLLGFGCMRFPKVSPDTPDIDVTKATEMVRLAYESGVNYFDTAYIYHGGTSEQFIGSVLRSYPRDSYMLASKMPLWCVKEASDIPRIFEEQLQRCGVEFFDNYLMHALDSQSVKKMVEYGAYEYLQAQREAGRIRNIGFSFHDSPAVLSDILGRWKWDFVQLQLNYVDWQLQNAQAQYEIATKAGIPVIVMEPIRGGALAAGAEVLAKAEPGASPASWALRFAGSLANVMTVLSGMSDMSQVRENISTFSPLVPLDGQERQVLHQAAEAYMATRTVPCTGCAYCMPCASGVKIPQVFAAYNGFCTSHDVQAFADDYAMIGSEHTAGSCTGCKACKQACPQAIDIPKKLEEIETFYESLS